jgi:hypothetical protein
VTVCVFDASLVSARGRRLRVAKLHNVHSQAPTVVVCCHGRVRPSRVPLLALVQRAWLLFHFYHTLLLIGELRCRSVTWRRPQSRGPCPDGCGCVLQNLDLAKQPALWQHSIDSGQLGSFKVSVAAISFGVARLWLLGLCMLFLYEAAELSARDFVCTAGSFPRLRALLRYVSDRFSLVTGSVTC